jgi:hypothetical protein
MKSLAAEVALALLLWVLPGRAGAEVVVTGAAPVVDTKASPIGSSIDARALERLPTKGRNYSELLLLVPGVVGGQPVDGVQVDLGAAAGSQIRPFFVQPGWSSNPAGGGIRFSGPPVAGGGPIGIGFRRPAGQAPVRLVPITLYDGRKVVLRSRLPVGRLNPVQRLDDPAGGIRLPPRLSPGDRIEYRPLDPKFTPGGGQWKIGGLTPKWNGSFDQPSYRFDLPLDYKLTPGTSLKVSYTDPWGETLVDGFAADVKVGPGPTPLSDRPSVSGCSPAFLSDAPFCVCGNFPPGTASELRINGAPVGQFLVASSPTILEYFFPDGAPAGEMEVGANSGFDIADGARGVLIRVRGEIDRDRLKRGESTTLKLWLDGTDRATDLRLWNSTPGIVSLAGGDDQVVTTSGGAPNQVMRTVDAVAPGDFALHYQLTVDSCPCAKEAGER